jgi:hypothetical protein
MAAEKLARLESIAEQHDRLKSTLDVQVRDFLTWCQVFDSRCSPSRDDEDYANLSYTGTELEGPITRVATREFARAQSPRIKRRIGDMVVKPHFDALAELEEREAEALEELQIPRHAVGADLECRDVWPGGDAAPSKPAASVRDP